MKHYRTGPETKRLHHRAFTVDDAEAFFVLNSNPDVMRFTGELLVPSLEVAIEAIAGYPDFDEVGYGRWACVLKKTQTVIGFCGLKYLPDLDAVDLGYRFLPEFWGQGIATEACRANLEFGFRELRLDQIVGLVLPDNAASIRVLEKVGMQPEGDMVYDGMKVLRFAKRR
ncbi:GNAT family N-acetyltransferase [Stieleria magnilauensis]|uniref:Ribosomal N-acetyltransferase YdaF n=1 Tax=Stieleria magnilauensis TaxID=2527963 RepID=A0ABX5XR80_9BACT|nr:Putative ribosomal N-acetyltransferase YdaF [Planctomycetes bacterium TBK1r]